MLCYRLLSCIEMFLSAASILFVIDLLSVTAA